MTDGYSSERAISSVLLIVAMKAEAEPIIQQLSLQANADSMCVPASRGSRRKTSLSCKLHALDASAITFVHATPLACVEVPGHGSTLVPAAALQA